MTRQVLFVCTGNVFRSLTAEYALRAALQARPEFLIASAGTDERPQPVPPEIVAYLKEKNFDVSAHRRRTLTRELLEAADVVIAMSLDHRDYIRSRYGRSVPVFLECCGHASEALLDLHEAVTDYRTNRAAALAYLRATIDRIVELTPRLASRILGDDSQAFFGRVPSVLPKSEPQDPQASQSRDIFLARGGAQARAGDPILQAKRLAMASRRKNIRKAARVARRQRTIAHLPKKTRQALGKEASKAAKRKKKA